jgi:hypothetical protein
MDKRLKELATKVGLDITTLVDAEKVEEFAKLIATECVNICRNRMFKVAEEDHQKSHNNAVFCCYSDINEHFGKRD